MAITGEDGTGVTGAEAYGDDPVALTSAYWAARPQRTESVTWDDADTDVREGSLREAAQYMDAQWGQFYIGVRETQTQGLQWPRVLKLDEADEDEDGSTTDTLPLVDDLGNEVPALPDQLIWAQAELAVRALSESLFKDQTSTGIITAKREKLGPLEEETKYAGYIDQRVFNIVQGILSPLVTGSPWPTITATWFWR